MAITPSSGSENQQQCAETFAIDFDAVRDAFDASGGVRPRADVSLRSVAGAGAAALVPLVMGAAEASAKGGEYGIIEGRTASFIHPIIMVSTWYVFV